MHHDQTLVFSAFPRDILGYLEPLLPINSRRPGDIATVDSPATLQDYQRALSWCFAGTRMCPSRSLNTNNKSKFQSSLLENLQST
jgi:hypothetical protein